MRRRRPRHIRGFTTVELLATLAILALLTSGVVAGLGVGRQSWRAAREKETRAELEAGMRAIRDVLSRAALVVSTPPGGTPVAAFDGRPDAVVFIALDEPGARWGGFAEVGIGLDAAAGKLRMTARIARPGVAAAGALKAQTVEVLGGVAELRLRYFGRLGDESTGRWFDDWRGQGRLPDLVAISVARRAQGRPQSADDVVALRQN